MNLIRNKESRKSFLLALLIFLPSCEFIPVELYLGLIVWCVYINLSFLKEFGKQLLKKRIIDKPFLFLIGFSGSAFFLRLFDYANWESVGGIYSFAYLFPGVYLIARALSTNLNALKYLLVFISIEALACILQYSIGVNTFFTGLPAYKVFEDYDLLYYTRVYGFSENSSLTSLKLMFGVFILNLVKIKGWPKFCLEILLLLASIIAFGRVALFGVFLFYSLLALKSIYKREFKFADFVPIGIIFIVMLVNPSWTKSQFTRNKSSDTGSSSVFETNNHSDTLITNVDVDKINTEITNFSSQAGIDKVDMSGRSEIWDNFLTFGVNNLWFGNKGNKYLINTVHAHNSWIEMFTSFGLLLFLVFCVIFLLGFNKENFVYILVISFLALGQYVIFWGVSFFDIIFYYIVFFYGKKK